jgi:electron transport complex protein RnfE
LLAVSTSVITGFGLGLATLITVVLSSVAVSATRRYIPNEIRLPVFVLIIAAVVTVVDILGAAWVYDLHKTLGLFVPLIVTNCVVLARLEAFASVQPVHRAASDGVAMGVGFLLALVMLGALREVVGTGCILAGARLLLPIDNDALRLCIVDGGLVFALLPPGAFLGLAALVVAHRYLSERASSASGAIDEFSDNDEAPQPR